MTNPEAKSRIGCAGWSLPRASWPRFPTDGTHLVRYAQRLMAVEVNSSFYRAHAQKTWEKWASSTPPDFRFSVKMPKSISHIRRLVDCEELLLAFLDDISPLGQRLGCLLLQLPPSLQLDLAVARPFLSLLRHHCSAPLALEPRHASWAAPEAGQLMHELGIARVVADPVLLPGGTEAAGSTALVYLRLHGAPQIYTSPYTAEALQQLAQRIQHYRNHGAEVWCIFDNTARGAATFNALDLQRLLTDG